MMKLISIVSLLLISSVALATGDFVKHEGNLNQFLSQIQSSESTIRDLIKQKNDTKDSEKSREIIDEIKKNLKDRKEAIIKYNKEHHHIRYEHPEGIKKFENKYKRYDEKSIKDFEDEINKILSNVYENIKKKYN